MIILNLMDFLVNYNQIGNYKYRIEIFKLNDINFIDVEIDDTLKSINTDTIYILKLYVNNNCISLKNNNIKFSYVTIQNIDNLKIEYDNNIIVIDNYIKLELDLPIYMKKINSILLSYTTNIDQYLETNNKLVVQKLYNDLLELRKIIGKHRHYCHLNNIEYDSEIKNVYIQKLKSSKEYLSVFSNENYYYNEVKNMITKYVIQNIKYSINIINKNFTFIEKIFNDYNKILKLHKNEIDNLSSNNECLEQYFSPISQTNWIDALQEGQFLGLIIRTKPREDFILSKNIDIIDIISITRSTIDLDMYFTFVNQYINEHNKYDNGIRHPMIKGNGIGEGNVLLPIYINSLHWKLGFRLAPIFCGIGTTNNPGLYTKNSLYLYHKVLIEMILETFVNKNIDDKWINLLFTIYATTIEINNLCENFDWDEFINDPLIRIKQISVIQILVKLLIDKSSFNIEHNKFNYLIKIILEECIRRIQHNNDIIKYNLNNVIKKDFSNTYDIKNDNLERYQNITYKILATLLFMNILKDISIQDFLNNNSLLKQNQIIKIKDYIKQNATLFDLEYQEVKYIMNPNYNNTLKSNIKIFNIDIINKIIPENIITQKQFNAMILQNTIQNNNKNRRIAIEKGKYNDPFIQTDKVLSFCDIYIKKRTIYESIDKIKSRDDWYNSELYSLYNNDEYKNILDTYITTNKNISKLLN